MAHLFGASCVQTRWEHIKVSERVQLDFWPQDGDSEQSYREPASAYGWFFLFIFLLYQIKNPLLYMTG